MDALKLTPPPMRTLLFLVVAVTALVTATVVSKCSPTHTLGATTPLSVRDVARGSGATVLASAQLVLRQRDTVVVHDTIVTYRTMTPVIRRGIIRVDTVVDAILSRVTRRATFRDSTFAGIIQGTITAPPDPAPLGIMYTMTRPLFSPTVAFLETSAHRPVAVVSWRGERVEVRDVFVPEISPPRTARLVALEYDPLRRVVEGRLGGALRLGGTLRATVSIVQRVGFDDTRVRLPSLWLGVQRTL